MKREKEAKRECITKMHSHANIQRIRKLGTAPTVLGPAPVVAEKISPTHLTLGRPGDSPHNDPIVLAVNLVRGVLGIGTEMERTTPAQPLR